MPSRVPGSYPARDPLSSIPPSRHPFQVWVMAALALSGASNFFLPGSEILQAGLDPVYHKVWAATLLTSSLLILASAWWPDRIMGLLMERLGLITMGLACPVYAVILFGLEAVGVGATGVMLTASIGIASLWRARHVRRELKLLRKFMSKSGIGSPRMIRGRHES